MTQPLMACYSLPSGLSTSGALQAQTTVFLSPGTQCTDSLKFVGLGVAELFSELCLLLPQQGMGYDRTNPINKNRSACEEAVVLASSEK